MLLRLANGQLTDQFNAAPWNADGSEYLVVLFGIGSIVVTKAELMERLVEK